MNRDAEKRPRESAMMTVRLTASQIIHIYFGLLIFILIYNAYAEIFTAGLVIFTAVVIPMLILTWWDIRQAKKFDGKKYL